MSAVRAIRKWFFRFCLLVIFLVAFTWLGIQVSRAYYLRQAQQPPSAFIVESAPVIALTHARLIDGTASPAQDDQTLILENGMIGDVGPSSSIKVPASARVIDLSGKTVFPGLVMLHEHLFTISPDSTPKKILVVEQPVSFPLMYLAAGVTTLRTTGSIFPQADLAIKSAIDSGQRPGPDMFLTAPYLESNPLTFSQMHAIAGPDEARRAVDEGAAEGMTSFKAYMHLTPEELKAAIDEAHSKGLKITGHLCSVGFTEAADMGIDNLEHGLVVDSEFFSEKKPGVCPGQRGPMMEMANSLDIESAPVRKMIQDLVGRHVAVTSTLAIFESFIGTRAPLEFEMEQKPSMSGESWSQVLETRASIAEHADKSPWAALLKKEMEFERSYVKAGGLLMAGCDPTGFGGILAGFGDQRELELLVEAGFTPVEAIHIYTENGAKWLGEDAGVG